ncbi:MAG TPA: ChuX/HutX family heme-like substrate-binding protein, partial [Dokdonella sp.]
MLEPTTTTTAPAAPPAPLREAWRRLRAEEPGLRARDLAERLGVGEGELVASRCGDGVTRLDGPWPDLIRELPALGRVMVLTRNDHCVHEKKGEFGNVEIGGAMGLVLNGAVDLRLFLKHWKHGFAVVEDVRGRTLESLQFFDADGCAVHKVYRIDGGDEAAWRALVTRRRSADQTPAMQVEPVPERLPHRLEDRDVDVDALRAGWRRMRDPHDFFDLLKKQRVTRTQALGLVGAEFARRVAGTAIGRVLDAAAASGLSLMVFVGSPGVVQIHTGPVRTIKRAGPWLNVLDEDFNLHLREDRIAESWIVKKPSPDGVVTSLELYDARGAQIAQVFGKRKPGTPELADWRALATASRASPMRDLRVRRTRTLPHRAAALLLAAFACAAAPLACAAGRVVSLGGDVTETVYALGAGADLVGVDSTSTWPPEAHALPDVGYLRQLAAEGVLALRPQLIVATHDAGPPSVIEQLRGAGVRVERLPPTQSAADVVDKVRRIGRLLGREREAESLAAKIEAEFTALAGRVAAMAAHPRVVFLMSAGT